MKKILILLILTFLSAALMPGIKSSQAGEIDILLQKLVEKGVLTPGEAQQIRVEPKEEMKKEIAQGKSETLPSWIQTMKIKGDLRLRYQWNKQKQSEDRHRGRLRLRVGTEAKVNDKLKVAFGIATGSTSDPRSTNQTFQDTFTMKNLVLDYAYADYNPFNWLTFKGGKMKNPIWTPTDLLWDSDINPEGAALLLSKKMNSNTEVFAGIGGFVLDESSGDTSDPFMGYLQGGVNVKATDKISVKLATTVYGFGSVKGNSLDHNSGTNSGASSSLKYDYDSISPALELKFSDPFYFIPGISAKVPSLKVFGEGIHNFDPSKNKNGFAAGFALGSDKVSNAGDWQFKYIYARLERDAWVDAFPDSDRYGGKTHVKGHEAIFEYGLGKNTSLALDYYYMKSLSDPKRPEHIIQADWNLKF